MCSTAVRTITGMSLRPVRLFQSTILGVCMENTNLWVRRGQDKHEQELPRVCHVIACKRSCRVAYRSRRPIGSVFSPSPDRSSPRSAVDALRPPLQACMATRPLNFVLISSTTALLVFHDIHVHNVEESFVGGRCPQGQAHHSASFDCAPGDRVRLNSGPLCVSSD